MKFCLAGIMRQEFGGLLYTTQFPYTLVVTPGQQLMKVSYSFAVAETLVRGCASAVADGPCTHYTVGHWFPKLPHHSSGASS